MTTNMMTNEKLLKLSAAAKIVPDYTGDERAPNPSTIYRWATRGIAGVRLKVIWAGGGLRTSGRWLADFFREVTAAKNGAGSQVSIEPKHHQHSASIDDELDREGL